MHNFLSKKTTGGWDVSAESTPGDLTRPGHSNIVVAEVTKVEEETVEEDKMDAWDWWRL